MKALLAATLVFGFVVSANAGETCANFSGIWKGTCSTSVNDAQEKTMEIRQSDCQSMLVDDHIVALNGLSTIDDKNEDDSDAVVATLLRWNKTKSQVSGLMTVVQRENAGGFNVIASDVSYSLFTPEMLSIQAKYMDGTQYACMLSKTK